MERHHGRQRVRHRRGHLPLMYGPWDWRGWWASSVRGGGGAAAPSYSAEATQYFSRLPDAISDPLKTVIAAAIDAWVADGTWAGSAACWLRSSEADAW